MRLLLVSLASLAFINTCHQSPYSAKMICTGSCDSVVLTNGLLAKFNHCAFIHEKGKIDFVVYSSLINKSGEDLYLERNKFSVSSSAGETFKSDPFVQYKSGKLKYENDHFSVPVNTPTDYVFSFSSLKFYSESDMVNALKSDTMNFVYNNIKQKTILFQALADDKRLK